MFGEESSGISGSVLKRTVEVEGAEASLQIEARLGMGDLEIQYMPALPGVLKLAWKAVFVLYIKF
jgi:hypothetical protein